MFTIIHALCVARPGDEKMQILPQTSSVVSLSLHACVAHLFSHTMFPRFATVAAKHSVCFLLI